MKRFSARTKHAMFMLMEHDIHRYLMDSTEGRYNGFMRAEHHMNLSYIYVAVRDGIDRDDVEYKEMMRIHNNTQEFAHDLYNSIKYPCHEEGATTRYDMDAFALKFFDKFIETAEG